MVAMALAIYGTIIFPKVLGHIEAVVIDYVEQVIQQIDPAPGIVVETLRSLNFCRRKGNGRFIGCAQLFEWPAKRTRQQWVARLRKLCSEEVVWVAPWMPFTDVLYKCGNKPWFIPITHWLDQLEFTYGKSGTSTEIKDIMEAWKNTFRSSGGMHSFNKVTRGYMEWHEKRVKDIVIPPCDSLDVPWGSEPQDVVLELKFANDGRTGCTNPTIEAVTRRNKTFTGRDEAGTRCYKGTVKCCNGYAAAVIWGESSHSGTRTENCSYI
ncbi:hypothetical protein COLO4_20929 [Corchorus olitorius]|uniref:DUF7745 domain-containing protein n=1 Tax=Corchorus olitorius TaxID=93759 RepID=A0A1R3IW28_9ROSI|nr:hypothetical protein COLO4_20929 [Corchorus olitorius]